MATEDEGRVDELLKQALALPVDKQRRIAATLGSLVADAAGTGLSSLFYAMDDIVHIHHRVLSDC